MKTNWQTKKLGEVLKLEYGKPLPKNERGTGGKYPVYGANGVKSWSDSFYYDKATIIVGRKGSAGEINLTEEKFWPLDVTYFVKFDDSKYNLKFLYNLLSTLELTKLAKGVKPGINRNDVYSIEIQIPPLPEQKRLITLLDGLFEKLEKAKENAEKNLANVKELFESYLQSAFANPCEDGEEKTLKEITSILGDGLHGTPKYTVDGEYYFINGNNLDNGKIVFKENTKKVSIEEYDKYKKNLNDRTMLVSINGTLCNVAFYNNEKVILGKSACYFNLLDGIDKNFIKYVIQSPYFIRYAFKEATGATIKNVSLKSMREFKMHLPKLEEQKLISAHLDSISAKTKKLTSIYQQKLIALEELKKSILQKAFSGQL